MFKRNLLYVSLGLALSCSALAADAVWTVKTGNTVAGIARTFEPQNDQARLALEKAIVSANPSGVVNGVPVVGAKIKIPGAGINESLPVVVAATPVTVAANTKTTPAKTVIAKPAAEKISLPTPAQKQDAQSSVYVETPDAKPVQVAQASVQQPVVQAKKRAPVAAPGMGKIPGVTGDDAMFNASVIHVKADKNELAYISKGFPNRIATPFKAPKLINSAGLEDDAITQVDSSLYVAAGFSEPIGIFITGSEPGDPVISLTLVPKPMPQQTITLILDSEGVSTAQRKDKQETSTYTGTMVERFRLVASGKTPAGFNESPMPNAVGRSKTMIVVPEVRFSGRDIDIFRYRVENVSNAPFELNESAFYQDGVLAVAIYPEITLRPGEQTFVLVAADKKLAGGE